MSQQPLITAQSVRVIMVQCRKEPSVGLKLWSNPYSPRMYERCWMCRERIDWIVYLEQHYKRFENTGTIQPDETFDDAFKRVKKEILSNYPKYEVPWRKESA